MRRSILQGWCVFAALAVAWYAPSALAADRAAPSAEPAAFTPAGQQSAPLPPQDETSNYTIGPGDMLQVFVWENPNLSVTIPVRPDGKISTPLVENMVAVGKTPSQLARDMEHVLSKYLRTPKVNIIVTQPLGALTEIKVIGQVNKPGAVSYHRGMKVLDALLEAGGLTQYAAGNRAKIIRTEGGRQREIRVKLEKLMDKGDISQNVTLEPNDVIVVPQSLF